MTMEVCGMWYTRLSMSTSVTYIISGCFISMDEMRWVEVEGIQAEIQIFLAVLKCVYCFCLYEKQRQVSWLMFLLRQE